MTDTQNEKIRTIEMDESTIDSAFQELVSLLPKDEKSSELLEKYSAFQDSLHAAIKSAFPDTNFSNF